ncbi:MAG: hypothetical protein MUF04_01190 [Akkermansiaceae bacterium]|jgi:hypothetical protein|nr:hypothetical protein [Akkermansiaceae bacterium]
MRPTLDEIQTVLAARRAARPGAEYWQEFIREFHHRQRAGLVPDSGLARWWARGGRFLSELGPAKWAYGAGLLYAGLSVAFLLMPAPMAGRPPDRIPVNHQRIPVAGEDPGPMVKPPSPSHPAGTNGKPKPADNGEVF